MSFTISHIEEDRQSFAPYRYRINRNGKEFAIFAHNYRGECEEIILTDTGQVIDPPFGMSSSFIAGGGRESLGLTPSAEQYLESLSNENNKPNKAEMATPRKPSDHFGS